MLSHRSSPPLLRAAAPLAALAALLVACGTGGDEPGEGLRPPGGATGKPVIDTPRGPAVADELVVRLAPGAGDQVAARLAAELGGQVVWRAPRTGAYLLRFADEAAATAALAELARRPGVREVVRQLLVQGTGVGTSPSGRLQWNLSAMGLDPDRGWGSAAGVRVAVLDTGVAYEDHQDATGTYALAPDLAGVTFLPGYDLVNDDAHPNDDHGHGTHVTAIIAQDGELRAVAPGAEIIPIKVLGADNLGTELGLAEGLLLAAEGGADVINLSLSFAPSYFPSRFLQEAVDRAGGDGALLVAAVGNHGGEVVTYPAAFRDVLAVAASSLSAAGSTGGQPLAKHRAPAAWLRTLGRAPYSNRGYLIDVTAPGGSVELDIDGDGNPEGILAQSFAGDPTAFEYLSWAGTSQAAAQVAGLAAVMIGESDRELTGADLRALLGETARRPGGALLDRDTGRGLVRAVPAMTLATTPVGARERGATSASVRLALVEEGGVRRARALVEVVDEHGQPVRRAEVVGSFTGGAFESHRALTDGDGRVELTSGPLGDGRLVGFQVEAVLLRRGGRPVVDRPGGFVRIDTCSLDRLSRFGDQLASGAGVGTSPSGPISLTLPALWPDEIAGVHLVNFSWSMATPAMAVVADRSWFDAAFPDAGATRVASDGAGLRGSPLSFTSSSFPIAIEASDDDECVDVLVRTYTTGEGVGTSPSFVPIVPDPAGSCSSDGTCTGLRGVLQEVWWAELAGSEVSFDGGSGVTEACFLHLVEATGAYAGFGPDPVASPVADYGGALEAAGIGVAPGGGPADDLGAGMAVWQ